MSAKIIDICTCSAINRDAGERERGRGGACVFITLTASPSLSPSSGTLGLDTIANELANKGGHLAVSVDGMDGMR